MTEPAFCRKKGGATGGGCQRRQWKSQWGVATYGTPELYIPAQHSRRKLAQGMRQASGMFEQRKRSSYPPPNCGGRSKGRDPEQADAPDRC